MGIKFLVLVLSSLILGLEASDCENVVCERNSKLKCEAVKSVFLQKDGFCYCCQLTPPKGEKGVCDKKYCEIENIQVDTKEDCHPKYEVFRKKNVEKCVCKDKCEPIWVTTPSGEECGKALCGLKLCPQILCGPNAIYVQPDACHCCMRCKNK